MIATERSCPSRAELRDLAGGLLPADRFSRLIEHVESCAQCQSQLDDSAEDDSFIVALASPAAPDSLIAEPDCIAALHRAAEVRESLGDRTSPPVENLGVYRLLRPLGHGAMGAVFLAEHTRLRRRCAIKLLPRDRGFDAQWRERFDREMAAVAAINHPHVVAATDAGESSGWHYLVMEYLDGLDLGRLAARMPPLGVADACELARQAAIGLAEIHAAGLVHRDIKPSNLMLTRDGVVKILDLGLVMPGTDPLPETDRLTTVGHLMGTLAYMAPEQLADSQAVDFRADLYALGATLYRLLAGAAPHEAHRGLAPLVIAKTAKDAPSIVETRSDLPERLARLVDSLLSREPLARGDSARAVAERLEPLTAGSNVKRLAGVALRKGASEEEQSSLAASLIPLAPEKKVSGLFSGKRVLTPFPPFLRPPRRPGRVGWIAAAAGLPLLVLLGIVMLIQTDRGRLVIESELDDVAVRIERGEDLVEELDLETGENHVTLRSGTYKVLLETVADGIRLSDDTATVTRGGEAILSVRREPLAHVGSTASADSVLLYRGKPLAHWLEILEHERDVELVIDAMTAAVELTKELDAAGDGLKSRVAESILRASRRFGAWADGYSGIGGLSAQSGPAPPSEQFMRYMPSLYLALLPDPGLAAITEELQAGNRRSAMACISVLSAYSKRLISDYASPEFGRLEQWSESDAGRKRLKQLAEGLDTAVRRLGGYGLQGPARAISEAEFDPYNTVVAAYHVRLRLATLLDENPFETSQLGERLRESLQYLADQNRERFANLSSVPTVQNQQFESSPELAGMVSAAYPYAPAETLAWAGLPQLLMGHQLAGDEELSAALTAVIDAVPREAADATLAAVDRFLHTRYQNATLGAGMGMGMGMGAGSRSSAHLPAIWSHALRNLAEHTSKPDAALQWLSGLRTAFETEDAPGEIREALDDAILRLQERVE